MFRNASAVKERSKVTSTSIVVIKDEKDNILSFDVEKKFQVKYVDKKDAKITKRVILIRFSDFFFLANWQLFEHNEILTQNNP